MNFKQIIDLSLNMIDETDFDEQVEIIVKSAINKAYADLCVKDKRLNRAFVPIINGVVTLPEDIIGVEKCTPMLSGDDKFIGNSIITDKSGTLELLYSYVREPMINDTDEPDLHLTLQTALATWACYKYFEYRKKVEVANTFLNNFNIEVFNFEQGNSNGAISQINFIDRNE